MTNTTIYFKGKLEELDWGESDLALVLTNGISTPINLLEDVANAIKKYGNWVNVRYWIDDKPIENVESATEEFLVGLFTNSRTTAEFTMVYSEITGYLWTDEHFIVGGHDVEQELRSYVGKWLLLEIEFIRND